MNNKTKIFIDAETASLRGQMFSFALTEVDAKGNILSEVCINAPREEIEVTEWVQNNVPVLATNCSWQDFLPTVKKILEDYNLLGNWGASVYAHFGSPVESGIFATLYENELIGEFDAPMIHEVGTLLAFAGEDPMSTESYIEKYNLTVDKKDIEGQHDPRYDNRAAAAVVTHITNQ